MGDGARTKKFEKDLNQRRRIEKLEGITTKTVEGMDVIHRELSVRIDTIIGDLGTLAVREEKISRVLHHIERALNGSWRERRFARKMLKELRFHPEGTGGDDSGG